MREPTRFPVRDASHWSGASAVVDVCFVGHFSKTISSKSCCPLFRPQVGVCLVPTCTTTLKQCQPSSMQTQNLQRIPVEDDHGLIKDHDAIRACFEKVEGKRLRLILKVEPWS